MNFMTIRLSKKNTIINVVLFIVFITFALLQLNDPDPEIWFFIYSTIAFICLFVNFRYLNQKIITTYIVILIFYAGFHFGYLMDWLQTNEKREIFGQMVYEKPYLEGSREFIGLFIGVLGLLFTSKTNKKDTIL